jgi:hypothetical protein
MRGTISLIHAVHKFCNPTCISLISIANSLFKRVGFVGISKTVKHKKNLNTMVKIFVLLGSLTSADKAYKLSP